MDLSSIHRGRLPTIIDTLLTSCTPVEAPLGTEALNMPSSVYMSTSTVGFPRESMISRPTTFEMADCCIVPVRMGGSVLRGVA